MLIEFNVTNFKSIKSKQTFSMIKAKGDELEDSNCFEPEGLTNLSLLKSAVIYGSNAAGKSNFINAMGTMSSIIVGSASELQYGDQFSVEPFKLDPQTRQAATEFEVIFISKKVRYQYGFTLTQNRIIEEWLIAFPKKRAQHWFARLWNATTEKYEWEMGNQLQGKKNLWLESTRSNALFLSTAVQLNSQQLLPVYDWFDDTLRTSSSVSWLPSATIEWCDDPKNKIKVLNLLKAADIDIKDLSIKNKVFEDNDLPDSLPVEIKEKISKKYKGKEIFDKLHFMHEDSTGVLVSFDFEEESEGTRKIFSFAGPWLHTLQNGTLLFVDELHDSLHPKLVHFLIELFHNKDTNPYNAQLVFTTHETNILNQEVFRRDQVWFCEKRNNCETSIYPLTEFSPRKKRENLELAYLAGRYGAIPNVRQLKIV